MHGVSQRSVIYLIAGVASILLSFWAAMRSVVINPDGICYLQSADSMALGLSVAAHLCDQAHWPFYSALIYGVSSVTRLSSLYSAYVIDGLFSLISVLAFLMIVRFLKGSNRVLWLAAFVILFAHEFNSLRDEIIRDHGFWAFYLLSVLFLLRFFQKPRMCYAFSWSISLIIATLFRIEGIFFLLVLPVLAFIIPGQRIRAFLKLNVLTIVGLIGVGIWYFVHPQSSVDQVGRVGELKLQLTQGLNILIHNFQLTALKIADVALSKYSRHEASLLLCLVLFSWYIIQVVGNLSLLYAVLVIYAWFKKSLVLNRSARWVLLGYVLLNVIITMIFLTEHMFLSKRYLVALSLILMLWVPFALETLYQKCKYLCALIMLLIVICSLGGIVSFGHSKKYLHDAGEWLESNVPQHASLFSNDYHVMYYSKHFGNDIFAKSHEFSAENILSDAKWKKYDYVALRFNQQDAKNNEVVMKQLGAPVQVFANKRGDEVVIYKTH